MELWRTVEGNIISILVSGGAITNNLEAAKFIKRYDVGTISPLLDLKKFKRYKVELQEIRTASIDIDAENEQDAQAYAEEYFRDDSDIDWGYDSTEYNVREVK